MGLRPRGASEDRRRFENWSGGLKFGEKNLIITKIIKRKISVGMKVELRNQILVMQK